MPDETWSRIDEVIRNIFSQAGIVTEESLFLPAIKMVQTVLSCMKPEMQVSTSRDMLSILELNGARLLKDVDMPRGMSPDRSEILNEIDGRLADRGARHLEMGVHTGFPLSRVASLVKERRLGEFLRLDMDPAVKPDVVADCAHLPFIDGSIDSVASDSLFEHMRFPRETIQETFRALAPGGVMQINMPFFFTIHNYPGDYMRLTPQYLEETCREAGFCRVYCHTYDFGGLYYTLHNLL